jgi:ribosome-binding factor A
MVSPRRIERLSSLIRARVAEIVQRELNDPRIGFVTITGVHLDREITTCKVYWSVLGDDATRRRNEMALAHARRYVQREMAAVLETRQVPVLQFVYDESIAGSIRVQGLIDEVNRPTDTEAAGGGESGDDQAEPPDPGVPDGS